MKKVLLLTAFCFLAITLSSQTIKSMSFNIRYDNPEDGINRWDLRKDLVIKTIEDYSPDFIGIQEALDHQTKYIDDKLSGYSFIGVGRDDGKTKGEYSPIFYKNELFNLISDSTIWLSETPERVSVGWDASMERICTFGRFLHIPSNKEIIVMNTHFDHLGTVAREKSTLLILKTIRELEITNLPIILCGDFNATPDEKAIKHLTEYFYSQNCNQPLIKGEKKTFTGFSPDATAENRIDYIFCKNLNPNRYLHITNRTKDGRYISDHLPVFLTVRF